jgi:hypothetical protein
MIPVKPETIVSELKKVESDIERLQYGRSDYLLDEALDYHSRLQGMLRPVSIKAPANITAADLAYWERRAQQISNDFCTGQPASIEVNRE